MVVLGFAVLADAAQLAFIIGAFIAGLAIGRSDQHERIAGDLNSVGGVLIPIFFVLIGVHADLAAMLRPSVLLDAAVLLAIAVAGKLLSAYGAAGTRSDRLLIGIGMVPRGEVGLIFASIGLAQGVLDDELYGALLLVVLLTTVVAPPALRWRMGMRARAVTTADDDTTPEPDAGWVSLHDGELVLDGRPPASAVVSVALQAAALARGGRPSDELLSWFGERRDVEVVWTHDDTVALLDVIRRGGPRAVRLLDVTGVLERGVPTVAAAVARRRADPSELDPLRVLRFPTVAHVDELLDESAPLVRGPAIVKLAALVLDVLGLDATPTDMRRLLDELAADDPPGVEHLLSSARLLRAAAGDVHGYDRAELLQLAAQIGSTAALDSATLLARASSPERGDRLDQVHELVGDVLAHPDLLDGDATVLADVRRRAAEALCHDEASIARLRAAPDSYVLTHEPDELARQARLIEPLPSRGTIRVAVSPEGTPDHWIVDVACRDTQGLLARLARALTAAGCDIAAATVATWPDGAAVDTFLVRAAVRPGARQLASAMETSLAQRLQLEPVADVEVEFDNASLPWHTLCVATGRDRPRHARHHRGRAVRRGRRRAQRAGDDHRRATRRPLRPHRPPRAQARRPIVRQGPIGAHRHHVAPLAQERNTAATRLMHAGNADPLNWRSTQTSNQGDGMRRKRALKYVLGGTAGAAFMTLWMGGVAFAQDADPVATLAGNLNMLWVVIGAILVIFMQAGFALVETGFCRAKHAAHVVSTNFAIFGLGFIGFFFVGFPLAFGGYDMQAYFGEGQGVALGGSLVGSDNWIFLFEGGWALSGSLVTPGILAFFLYMVAFMDTVATIPTGAMAERWKWGSFVIWGLFCGAIYYPLFAAWTWGGGWLAKTWDTMSLGAGYVDFAGSGVVHAVGGAAALAGATRPRAAHREVRTRRQATGVAGPPHPDGHARHVHPPVRLVRLQRRIDVRGDRRPVRHRRHEHGHRRRLRRHRRHAVDHAAGGQARPGHDGQRHARRPRGDHRPVRVRHARHVGGDRLRSPACS